MNSQTYLQVLLRRWMVPVALLLAALVGATSYHYFYDLSSATATVGVLDPLTARPAGEGTAQITFETVMKSNTLAERVGNRVGLPSGTVAKRLSVKVATLSSTAANLISPVYDVTGRGKTESDALKLTSVAIEEARLLYIDLNTPDPREFSTFLSSQERDAQAQLTAATTALSDFNVKNNATDLPVRLAAAEALVNGLDSQAISLSSDIASAAAQGQVGTRAGLQAKLDALQGSLQSARAEVTRLTGLQAQYTQLYLDYTAAQARVSGLSSARQGLGVAERPPFASEIRVVDAPSPDSQTLLLVLEYGLAVVGGLLLGAAAIYVLALVERPLQTAASVTAAFDAPLLARIPHGGKI